MAIVVKIRSRATRKTLDVPGSDPANGVQIQQFEDNGGMNQQWRLEPAGPGLAAPYRIISMATGKVLDVPGFNPNNGVIIQQFEDNGGANQHWFVDHVNTAGPEHFAKIRSEATGKVLDVPGFDRHDGVKIQQFTDNGGDNQLWQIIHLNEQLQTATVSFHTNDEDKDGDTRVTVSISEVQGTEVARVDDYFGGFPDNTDRGPFPLQILKASLKGDLESGTVTLHIEPHGDDTWRFDFSINLGFTDGTSLFSAHRGIELSEAMSNQTFPLQ